LQYALKTFTDITIYAILCHYKFHWVQTSWSPCQL